MCMCMCHGCVGARPYVRPLALWLIMLYAAVPPGRYRGRGATGGFVPVAVGRVSGQTRTVSKIPHNGGVGRLDGQPGGWA